MYSSCIMVGIFWNTTHIMDAVMDISVFTISICDPNLSTHSVLCIWVCM